MYILRTYKFLRIYSYDALSDYCFTCLSIISCSMLAMVIEKRPLVQDLTLFVGPFQYFQMINLMNPMFNRDYIKLRMSILLKCLTGATLLLFWYVFWAKDTDWQAVRQALYLMIVVLTGATMFTLAKTCICFKNERRSTFLKILLSGGFPRFQIVFAHLFSWGVYYMLLLCTNVYFAYALLWAYLSGYFCLFTFYYHNQYFRLSVRHRLSGRRITARNFLPRNAHDRNRFEVDHIYSGDRENR